jgi:hypothetical protein
VERSELLDLVVGMDDEVQQNQNEREGESLCLFSKLFFSLRQQQQEQWIGEEMRHRGHRGHRGRRRLTSLRLSRLPKPRKMTFGSLLIKDGIATRVRQS